MELAVLECLKNFPQTYNGKIVSPCKLMLVTRTGIKAWTSLILGLWFPWPIYMLFEMRFDLGTLDSGELSLPFGLLVCFVKRIFCAPLSSKITF